MKRLVMLAVLCAFVLSAATASAAEFKATGAFTIEALWYGNWNYDDDTATPDAGETAMKIQERLDLTFQFIASENLKGVAAFRYGAASWGTGGFQIGNQGTQIGVQSGALDVWQAYVNFNWPGTMQNISAGMQTVTLPNQVCGSFILDEEAASVIVTGPITDTVSYLAGYVRAIANDTTPNTYLDAYAVALPLSFEGLSLVPFGVYANVGTDVAATAAPAGLRAYNATTIAGADVDDAWWLGLSMNMSMFDPFVIKADLNYGTVESSAAQNERDGWMLAAALEYTGFEFMTPELAVVYTSGLEGNSSTDDSRMPLIDSDYHPGTFFFGGERLLMGANSDSDVNNMGFWAVVVSLKDIQSFAEGLSHTFIVMYAEGTNDKDAINVSNTVAGSLRRGTAYGQTLTEEDSLWEIDFNTAYKIYDELTASLDLGYVSLDCDTNVWGANNNGGDAYKVSLGVKYSF